MRLFLFILLMMFISIAQSATGLTYTTSYCGSSWPCSMTASALSTGTLSTGDVNLNWGSGAVLDSGRSDYVVVKLEGYFVMPGTLGTSYLVTFTNQDDDGSRTIIGGTTVVDDWSGLHAPADRSGSITLVGGTTYSYVRWNSEWGGGAVLRQFWKIGSGTTTYMNFADDFTTTSGPSTSTTTGTSSGISSTQSTKISTAASRASTASSGTNPDNSVYIDQAGDGNTINILQDGSTGNHIRGIGVERSVISGDSNNILIKQGSPTSWAPNLIELMLEGDSNDLDLFQDRNDDGTENYSRGDHIIKLNVDGNLNAIEVIQRATGTAGHYADIDVTGNSSNFDVLQKDASEKQVFIDVTGNSNIIDVTQQHNSSKFLDITLNGNAHDVTVLQKGLGAHNATIDLTYGSASSTVDLTQQGDSNQSYSLTQTCYTAGGCSVSVTQE
jgi:hypothetical protein